jgi:hypothetical protein
MKRGYISVLLLAAVLLPAALADHAIKPHPKILWNVKAYPTPPNPETTGVAAVEFSPEDEQIIAAGWDGSIKFLNRSNGIASRTIFAHTGAVHSVSISKDGLLLASGGADRMLNLWRVSDGTLLRRINAHTTAVYSVAFSPDASLVISGGGPDYQLKIWRTADGELVRSIHGNGGGGHGTENGMYSVAFAPNGQYVAGSGLEVWRLDGTVVRATQPSSVEAETWAHVKFMPDSKRVVGSVLYGVWARGIEEETGFYAAISLNPAIAISADGRSLVTVIGVRGYACPSTWNVMPQDDGDFRQHRQGEIWNYRCIDGECALEFSWLALDPRMRTMAAGSYSGEVLLFELPIWISAIQRNGNQLNLQWQGGSGNYQLQKLTPPGTWQDLGGPVTNQAVSLDIDSSMALLRVRNVP